MIKSGHIVEIYEYQYTRAKVKLDIVEVYDGELEEKEIETGKEKIEKANEDRKDEYRARTNMRARNTLRRIINANFDNTSLFITLTFAKNITDISYANNEFKKFTKRMRYIQLDFAYSAVIEFQKRGAIHYHMICNWRTEWTTHEELQAREREIASIWRHGYADIQEIKHLDNVGAYLIKYMSKNNIDERLEGKKRYFYSKSLIKPEEITGEEAVKLIEEYTNKIPVFTNEYSGEWTGVVKYAEYNPLRYDKMLNGMDSKDFTVSEAIRLFGEVVEVV